MEESTERMANRFRVFTFELEKRAFLYQSKAVSYTTAYFLLQSLIFHLATVDLRLVSGATPWYSAFFSLAYLYALTRPVASFHRIHDRLDRLPRFQHFRSQTHGFGIASTDFLQIGLINPQIPTVSEIRFKIAMRRVKTGGFVILMVVFAVVMLLACRWLPPQAAADGEICCSLY